MVVGFDKSRQLTAQGLRPSKPLLWGAATAAEMTASRGRYDRYIFLDLCDDPVTAV